MFDNDYKGEWNKERDLKEIRKYYDIKGGNEYTIDEQSWYDLEMDDIYETVDKTYSTVGEAALYCMLRNPIHEEKKLKDRKRAIDVIKEDSDLRRFLQNTYFNISKDKKNNLLYMIENKLEPNKLKYILYTFLGKVVPLLIILSGIFIEYKYILGLFLISFLNMIINMNEERNTKFAGIIYLAKVIRGGDKVANIEEDELKSHTIRIRELLKELKVVKSGTRFINFMAMFGGALEWASTLFLLEEATYYKVVNNLARNKDNILELYYILGELEALVSIASYQDSLKNNCSIPKFTEKVALRIVDGVHPLLENPVGNSITIEKKGIVLTGTNMSGKSTFLKMLGVNMIFAQTFYFVLAKEYEAPFFNIISSISPKDDISEHRSYYLAEAENILRIINAMEKPIPVFCTIDEIFRGTNPVERIAASAEILNYINNRKCISIVTTHDRELVDLVKDKYDFYHFSESVSDKKGLNFDYKLKKGVTKSKNAIKLLEYIGYPKEITENAFKRVNNIEGFI